MIQIKFLNTLVVELMSDQNNPFAKQLAGVLFKNTLVNPTKVIFVDLYF